MDYGSELANILVAFLILGILANILVAFFILGIMALGLVWSLIRISRERRKEVDNGARDTSHRTTQTR